MIDETKEFFEYHSSRCPECESTRHTSRLPKGAKNFDKLYNHCMDCGHDFSREEALPSLASIEAEGNEDEHS